MEINETLYIGDVVRMRKPHPCGGSEWEVVRVGADIGLTCQTCGRRVLLTRRKFARQAKTFVRRGPSPQQASDPDPASLGKDEPTHHTQGDQ